MSTPTNTTAGDYCRRCGNTQAAHVSGQPCPTSAQAAKQSASILTLSYKGDVPAILRAVAAQLEAGAATVNIFRWSMTDSQLEFGADLNMDPKE